MSNVLKILACAVNLFTTVMNNVKGMKGKRNLRKKEHKEKELTKKELKEKELKEKELKEN